MGLRPLVLQGHTRAITRARVNREGDLLFTSAKDKEPTLWFLENGERLGTYVGHDGAVNDIDVTWDSSKMVSGGGDDNVILWDVETGKIISRLKGDSVIKSVSFGYSGQIFCYTNMFRSKVGASLKVVDLRDPDQFRQGSGEMRTVSALEYPLEKTASCSVFSHLDDQIMVGVHKQLQLFDLRTPTEPINFVDDHKDEIRDLQLSADRTCVITASKDRTSRLFKVRNMEPLDKVFQSSRPVNAAAISPSRPHVVIGGGEDAMTVTQTASAGGHFESKFYHAVFGDEFANIRGHFGPINTIAYTPDGDSFITGGEDGFVRITTFDEEFNNFKFDC